MKITTDQLRIFRINLILLVAPRFQLIFDHYDDQYYLDIGSEPPRFADYRAAQAMEREKIGDSLTYEDEDVWDSITQDELDYYLKMKLRGCSKDRYTDNEKVWYFHESFWYMRRHNGYD